MVLNWRVGNRPIPGSREWPALLLPKKKNNYRPVNEVWASSLSLGSFSSSWLPGKWLSRMGSRETEGTMSMLAWGILLSPLRWRNGGDAGLGFCCDLSAGNSPWEASISLWELDKYRSGFLYSFTKMHFYFHFPGVSITAPSDLGIKGNIQTESAAGGTPVCPVLIMLLLRSG